MAHYVLKFRGAKPRRADVDLIEHSGVTVLDRFGAAMLVDASEAKVRQLREQLAGWTITPETTYPPPGPVVERVRGGGSRRGRG